MKEKKKLNIKEIKRYIKLALPILVGFSVFLVCILIRFGNIFGTGEVKILTESTLMKSIDISTMSTARFYYNGIAEVLDEDDPEKVECYILYSAIVKAGVEFKDIRFDVDQELKTVYPIIPEINITNIEIEKGLQYYPENPDIEVGEAQSACESDAKNEAQKANQLYVTAESNLENVLSVLLEPVVDAYDYKLEWK